MEKLTVQQFGKSMLRKPKQKIHEILHERLAKARGIG
jgi:hypothetical protein